MKCPHCQTVNREGRKYCSACGKPFQLTCPSCGTVNEPGESYCGEFGHALNQSASKQDTPPTSLSPLVPTSFANSRYQVKKMQGEGVKKKVYLAHDTFLDRDIAIYLIKTEKLDETGRTRITREVQAMAKLGDHPNIATVYDYSKHEGQPYMVAPPPSSANMTKFASTTRMRLGYVPKCDSDPS